MPPHHASQRERRLEKEDIHQNKDLDAHSLDTVLVYSSTSLYVFAEDLRAGFLRDYFGTAAAIRSIELCAHLLVLPRKCREVVAGLVIDVANNQSCTPHEPTRLLDRVHLPSQQAQQKPNFVVVQDSFFHRPAVLQRSVHPCLRLPRYQASKLFC